METNTAIAQDTGATAQVQEPAPVEKPKATTKVKGTGDLIHDLAVEIEGLTKTKALNRADKLAENIETNTFELGGVLALILKEQWFEGYPTFKAFVEEKYDIGESKAHYLIRIYRNLVDKSIPWEKVQHLGWSKLKELAAILTLDNLDEWVAKAEKLSVIQLRAVLKGDTAPTGDGTTKVGTSDTVKLKFTVHADQSEQISTALAKAKAELSTDHDNVALAGICSGYLANASGVNAGAQGAIDWVAQFQKIGFEQVLGYFEQAFPEIVLDVTLPQSQG